MQARHTIAYRMARIIVVVTLCLGLAIGSLQVFRDYQQRQDNFNAQIRYYVANTPRFNW